MKELKNELIAIRIDGETRKKLEKIAKNKDRTTSNLIRIIIKSYLEAHEL